MFSTTQTTNSIARDGTTIPDGFAMGAVPGGHGQYLMPHYMLPAYEHSLLVDGCRLATARPAGSAEPLSPYDGSAMPPNVQMPDDPSLNSEELLRIHRLIKAIQSRDGVSYDLACQRLYFEQFEVLKVADEDSKAWQNIVGSIDLSLFSAAADSQQDPQKRGPK